MTVRYCTVYAARRNHQFHDLFDITAFNTDGIDVVGEAIHIHDCSVWCQDDAVCVKPKSQHVLIERVKTSGVGFTLGSIYDLIYATSLFVLFVLLDP